MANLKGVASFVSALRVERTNLVDRLRYVDAALSVLGKLGGGSNYTKPRRTLSASARKRISLAQKSTMGTGEGASAETQAHDLSSRQKENRGGAAGKVGAGEGGEEKLHLDPHGY